MHLTGFWEQARYSFQVTPNQIKQGIVIGWTLTDLLLVLGSKTTDKKVHKILKKEIKRKLL